MENASSPLLSSFHEIAAPTSIRTAPTQDQEPPTIILVPRHHARPLSIHPQLHCWPAPFHQIPTLGLDPKSTASTFAQAQCLGEKRVGEEECFVLKAAADRATIVERSDGAAEVIRHVLYGYFSQRSGLLVYMEDSHLTRIQPPGADAVYWETTIGSSVEDYREVDGVLIAHCGRSVATIFRFGDVSMQHSRTRMEEVWRIDDVVFNVPGLSVDYFIPPADIFDATPHNIS
ncbi:hypothetical protein ACLOJK_029876 [Asimina triloba]